MAQQQQQQYHTEVKTTAPAQMTQQQLTENFGNLADANVQQGVQNAQSQSQQQSTTPPAKP
jgi:hypothetical protein